MQKLKYLAKDYASKEFRSVTESFTDGFKSAFKAINESLTEEINRLEQYPMMGERIFALKLYMNKMDNILKESDSE